MKENLFGLSCVIFLSILLATFGLGFSNGFANLSKGDRCDFDSEQSGFCQKKGKCDDYCNETLNWKHCGPTESLVCCPDPLSIAKQRVSARECAKFKESACIVSWPGNRPNQRPRARKSPNCPFSVAELIAGGKKANRNEFPHMAAIGYTVDNATKWQCGGTLVSEQFVLTAAHCVLTDRGKPKYVRLGVHDLSGSNDTKIAIADWIVHPNYTPEKYYNDIALLRLNKTVSLTRNIKPACLPQIPINASKAMATGWGQTDMHSNTSDVLMKVTLDLFSQSICTDTYEENLLRIDGTMPPKLDVGINEYQVCGGSLNLRNNTCSGDSGGPLQIYHPKQFCSYIVIGITSFGDSCPEGRGGASSVYTRVFPFLQWIEEVVWLNSSSTHK